MDDARQLDAQETTEAQIHATCRCIDWYSEGQSRTVEVGGIRITVRFIGRKGRRGRVAIEAPAGAVFRTPADGDRNAQLLGRSP